MCQTILNDKCSARAIIPVLCYAFIRLGVFYKPRLRNPPAEHIEQQLSETCNQLTNPVFFRMPACSNGIILLTNNILFAGGTPCCSASPVLG